MAPRAPRRATAADCPGLTALCLVAKASNGYDAAFMEACRGELTITPDRLDEVEMWVMDGPDGPAACAALEPTDVPDLGEVALFFTDPRAQGRGLGRALMGEMLSVIRRKRLVLNIPFWPASIIAGISEIARFCSFGLLPAPLTRDQVTNLRNDNVVDADARGFADLGIEPSSLEAVLPEYLWRFRPSGQYDEIKESARGLRT